METNILTKQSVISHRSYQGHGKRQCTCTHCFGSGMMNLIQSMPSIVEIRRCTMCFGKGVITSFSKKMKR